MTPPRVLVTGATGFLGSHVAAAFVEAGHPVRCSIRPTSDLRWLGELEVELVEMDVCEGDGLVEALADVGIVVHSAGLTRARSEAEYFRVNATGAARVAEAAVAAKVPRFVLVSSLAARGPDSGVGPVSPYGNSKRRGEDLVRLFEGKMEIVVLRPGGIYGPRDTELLPLFQTASRGWLVAPVGGPPVQPVFVTDVAGLTLAAGTRGYAGVGPYPVAEERAYAWRKVGEGLSAALGKKVRVASVPASLFALAGFGLELAAAITRRPAVLDRRRAADLSRHGWTCDTSETRRAFGWRAEVGLQEGLARTAEWYRREGWL